MVDLRNSRSGIRLYATHCRLLKLTFADKMIRDWSIRDPDSCLLADK